MVIERREPATSLVFLIGDRRGLADYFVDKNPKAESVSTQRFSSFDAFFDSVRYANLRAMILEPDRGNWSLTSLAFNNISIQWGWAAGKAIVEGAGIPGGVSIFLQTHGIPAFSGNGRRLDELCLMVIRPGEEFCLAADPSPRRWCSLYGLGGDLVCGNEDATAAARPGVVRVLSEQIERFRLVLDRLDEVVQREPAAFDASSAQTAAQQKLVRVIRDILGGPREAEATPGRHQVSRPQIVRKSMEFVEQHDGEFVSVEQLANAAGVSERTLRDAFQQYFGVSPIQYLNRRTLHQVRKTLQAADPTITTVTEILTRFGVWQFGRFARDYRFLFAELPSKTLRH